MKRGFQSAVLRYGLALAIFALLLLFPYLLRNLFSLSFDTTFLIIIAMIACAWYLGRGPGLLMAVLFEATLIYFSTAPFSSRTLIITFNRMLLFVGVVLFASARRNAEKELRKQRELLQVTLASIGDAVIATDLNGKINFINPVAEKLTGWLAAEACGKPLEKVFQIINEESRAPLENPFQKVIRAGVIVGLANHTILKTRDAREIPIEDSGAPIKDSAGKVVGVVIVFRDISERRSAEREREQMLEREQAARSQAEAANRFKDEFLATVSHELRTPLNAILGWASLLNRREFKEESVRNALEVIERSARAQSKIVNDILDVSRVVNGKLRIKSQLVELVPIIESAIETIRPAADAKSIEINVRLASGKSFVRGDADRLQQIIWNLLANAIKFTPPDGKIEVRLEKTDPQFEIKISDNGAGISKEFLPHVFERFTQADSSMTRTGGLGLGLAIVRHLVELHGGTVSAESEGEGRGSTFIIRLPAASTATLSGEDNSAAATESLAHKTSE